MLRSFFFNKKLGCENGSRQFALFSETRIHNLLSKKVAEVKLILRRYNEPGRCHVFHLLPTWILSRKGGKDTSEGKQSMNLASANFKLGDSVVFY